MSYPNLTQSMFTFAFLADITEATYYFPVQFLVEQDVKEKIDKTLTDLKATTRGAEILQGWSCIANPWVIRDESRDTDSSQEGEEAGIGWLAKNTTVLFASEDPDNSSRLRLVIAVAGTNFISKYDWFTQDAEVGTQYLWNDKILTSKPDLAPKIQGEEGDPPPVVAKGTQIALCNTWKDHNGEFESLITWLKTHLKDPKFWGNRTELDLYVTGHSLGGAIAPVLAQALKEFSSEWFAGEVKGGGKVTLNSVTAYPFAGPTVGNQAFVDYVLSPDGVNIGSYYNTRDVVPHAWELDMMSNLQGIFSFLFEEEQIANDSSIVNQTIAWLRSKSEKASNNGYPYMRWGTGEVTFTPPFDSGWKQEMLNLANDSTVLNGLKGLLLVPEFKENCKTICNTGEDDLLLPNLQYFIMYMGMLGMQHVKEYPAMLISDSEYETILETALGLDGKTSDLKNIEKMISGPAVLFQLFADVAAFVKAGQPEAVA